MFNEKITIKKSFKNEIKEGNYIVINKKTGLVMDVFGGAGVSGAKIIQYGRHNGSNQRFKLILKEDGECEFSPQSAPHMALDIAGASKEENAPLQIYEKNDTAAQRFRFERNADGTYKIFTKCSDFSLVFAVENDSEANSAKIVQKKYTCATADWTLEKID